MAEKSPSRLPMNKLANLVDISLLRQMESNLSQNLGFTVFFEDLDGNSITQVGPPSRPFTCKSCQLLARYPAVFAECRNSDVEACRIVAKNRTPLLYKCRGNFSNFVIPVKVRGEVIGNVFGGQFFVLEPKDKLEKQLFNPLEVFVKGKSGKNIKGGFFYRSKELKVEQKRKIARERSPAAPKVRELRAHEIDSSLERNRIVNVRKFISDFRTLEIVAETLSSYAQKVLKLRREFGQEYKLLPKPEIPIDIPPKYSVLFKLFIPQGELQSDGRRFKEFEINMLNSTLSDEVRRCLAETMVKMPEYALDPEIKKLILEEKVKVSLLENFALTLEESQELLDFLDSIVTGLPPNKRGRLVES